MTALVKDQRQLPPLKQLSVGIHVGKLSKSPNATVVMAMLVLFCGSRGFTDYRAVDRVLDKLCNLDADITVLHGGAKGPDTFAWVAAVKSGCKHIVVHPDWHRFGKQAGFLRNAQMLEMNPDIVCAFWDGASRGTRHTVDLAINRYRIPTLIYLQQNCYLPAPVQS